jgi:hypothetical protein
VGFYVGVAAGCGAGLLVVRRPALHASSMADFHGPCGLSVSGNFSYLGKYRELPPLVVVLMLFFEVFSTELGMCDIFSGFEKF